MTQSSSDPWLYYPDGYIEHRTEIDLYVCSHCGFAYDLIHANPPGIGPDCPACVEAKCTYDTANNDGQETEVSGSELYTLALKPKESGA